MVKMLVLSQLSSFYFNFEKNFEKNQQKTGGKFSSIFLYFYMVELQGAEKPIFAIIDTM